MERKECREERKQFRPERWQEVYKGEARKAVGNEKWRKCRRRQKTRQGLNYKEMKW